MEIEELGVEIIVAQLSMKSCGCESESNVRTNQQLKRKKISDVTSQ